MPATLDQAFQSPFHKYVNPTGAHSSNSSYDIRNTTDAGPVKPPMGGDSSYFEFQNNYRVKNAVDIVSEADEIKSVYDSKSSSPPHHSESSSDHDCNYLIAKLLSCSRCRTKLKELLKEDPSDTHTHDDTHTPASKDQRGGGFGSWDSKSLLINIILGVLLILLIDFVLR